MEERICTASFDQMRCDIPAEGNSDLCQVHRKKCAKLYRRYKEICDTVPEFDYCNQDISSMEIAELEALLIDMKQQYIKFQKCIEARYKHNDQCYVLECRNESHAQYYNKINRAMTTCDTTLVAINQRLDDERKRLASMKRTVSKIESVSQATTSLLEPSSTKSKSRRSKSKKKSKAKEESFILEEAIKSRASIQTPSVSRSAGDEYYQSLLDILEERKIPQDQWGALIRGAYLRLVFLRRDDFVVSDKMRMKLLGKTYDNFEEIAKTIQPLYRDAFRDFFKYTLMNFTSDEIDDILVSDDAAFTENRDILIKKQRADEDDEKRALQNEVIKCINERDSKLPYRTATVFALLDLVSTADNPATGYYAMDYLSNMMIAMRKMVMPMYIKLFFTKAQLRMVLEGCLNANPSDTKFGPLTIVIPKRDPLAFAN